MFSLNGTLKKSGSVGRWETKQFIGMAYSVRSRRIIVKCRAENWQSRRERASGPQDKMYWVNYLDNYGFIVVIYCSRIFPQHVAKSNKINTMKHNFSKDVAILYVPSLRISVKKPLEKHWKSINRNASLVRENLRFGQWTAGPTTLPSSHKRYGFSMFLLLNHKGREESFVEYI